MALEFEDHADEIFIEGTPSELETLSELIENPLRGLPDGLCSGFKIEIRATEGRVTLKAQESLLVIEGGAEERIIMAHSLRFLARQENASTVQTHMHIEFPGHSYVREDSTPAVFYVRAG